MRLIDADHLKAVIREDCKTCKVNRTEHCKKWCIVNDFCNVLDSTPTANGIISSEDFKKRINSMQYVYIQSCAEDVIDAIDCEVTYFKEKMTKDPNSES